MRYFVGFVLAVAMVGWPLGVSAEESFARKPYMKLELDSSVLNMRQTMRGIGGIDHILVVRGEWLPNAELAPHEKRLLYPEGLAVASPMHARARSGEAMASHDRGNLAFLIPRHMQKRIPGGSAEAEFGLEYKEPEASKEEQDRKNRRRRLGLGIGLGVGLPLVGLAIGAAAWSASFSFE